MRSIGVMDVIYHRSPGEYGCLKGDQMKRRKASKTGKVRLWFRGFRLDFGQGDPTGAIKEIGSPARPRACVIHVTVEPACPNDGHTGSQLALLSRRYGDQSRFDTYSTSTRWRLGEKRCDMAENAPEATDAFTAPCEQYSPLPGRRYDRCA